MQQFRGHRLRVQLTRLVPQRPVFSPIPTSLPPTPVPPLQGILHLHPLSLPSPTIIFPFPFYTEVNSRTIILVVVFVVIPSLGLYLCCNRGRLPCFGPRKEKKNYYNQNQFPPGGVYLVPVNQFVPPDSRTGYTVRVDTPSNPMEMAMPVYPELHPPPVRGGGRAGRTVGGGDCSKGD